MLDKESYNIENNGVNNGVSVGVNNGVINVKSKKNTISILSYIIKNITQNINLEEDINMRAEDLIPFKIEEKIKANMVIKYRPILKKYKVYYSICDVILDKFDNNNLGENCKNKLLNNINDLYYEALGEFQLDMGSDYESDDIDFIKEEKIADKIIEHISSKLKERLENNMLEEDKDLGINIILCYAFIRCKILEKPKCKEK